MPHFLLKDNWTLQNAGELICNGLDGDTAHDLVFSAEGALFKHAEVSQDVIRIKALCQLLSGHYLNRELVLAAAFVGTRMKYSLAQGAPSKEDSNFT